MGFDPYAEWLQIAADRRPPNYYELLGLPPFTSDPDAIRAASMQRSGHVRKFCMGQHGEQANRILGELAGAMVCLTDPVLKLQYDQSLHGAATVAIPAPTDATLVGALKWIPVQSAAAMPVSTGVARAEGSLAPVPIQAASAEPSPSLTPQPKLSARVGGACAREWRRFDCLLGALAGAENGDVTRLHVALRVLSITLVLTAFAVAYRLAGSGGDATPDAALPASAQSPRDESSGSASDRPSIGAPPEPAVAPFSADQARAYQQSWAAHLGTPAEYENSIGMKFVLIPPGEFLMGSTPEEIEDNLRMFGSVEVYRNAIQSEGPRHKVVLTQPIYLAAHEVTQAQFAQVMERNPSHFAPTGPGKDTVAGLDTSGHPVEQVNWSDAAEFCAKLSEQEKLKPFYSRDGESVEMLAGTGYRLPTEAEWEFACRAGTTTKYWTGDKAEDLLKAAWSAANSGGRTHAAGELMANPFGLFDTHGNVYEWVQDWWELNSFEAFTVKAAIDPGGAISATTRRSLRGGFWGTDARFGRSSFRFASDPINLNPFLGFRVALTLNAVKASLAER